MPYCRPHGFVPLWIGHRETEYFELPQRETGRVHHLLAIKENSKCYMLSEAGESISARMQAARVIQQKRFSNLESSHVVCNADIRVEELRPFCKLQDEGQNLMRAAMAQLNLSVRACHRILKLARTIADLAGCEEIQSVHLAETPQYRPKFMMW